LKCDKFADGEGKLDDGEDGERMGVCGGGVGFFLSLVSTLLDGDEDRDEGGFRMLILTL